ncbi:right-handed parallel beta-helix repeat-containing protein [Anaeromyxobacter diazotrophicus]|uniref:Right handed beta helix domain-containing protein n=1 Tax=Anaeromyxobacter diazotrophicus TaxID=2590199 RepID=A0A7I9VKI3_9BACT|nr:right-handed parallel beta-helix repeat-containing protein [Anaeromyxobacter diazotrophicus]GEJ56901.1 hypothetical protein AMYX_16420 [Anaeromyxobacter diazotrophicus]
MRAAALPLALALCACQVATEGAPCSSAASCPSGQRCGADGRCSASAASCPPPGLAFHVDPVAGSDLAQVPEPTGALAPAACRFRALGPALLAAAQAAGPGGAAVTVQVHGGTASGPAVFTELLPPIAAGVSLSGGDGPDGAYVLQPPSPIVLVPGASLSGFVLRPGADRIDGVVVACAGASALAAVVHDVRVEGAAPGGAPPSFSAGVRSTGACSVTVKDATFDGVAVAVQARAGGTLLVDGCTIVRGGRGVWLDGSVPLTATIRDTTIEQGSDTGLQVDQATRATLTLAGNTIDRNCAIRQRSGRRGGGVVFLGGTPGQLAFTGNRVYGNGYDQVLVDPAGAEEQDALQLVGAADAARCATEANQLDCYDPLHGGMGVAWAGGQGGVHVAAQGNSWAAGPPAQGADYGAGVDAGAAGGWYCPAAVLPCPQPPVACP